MWPLKDSHDVAAKRPLRFRTWRRPLDSRRPSWRRCASTGCEDGSWYLRISVDFARKALSAPGIAAPYRGGEPGNGFGSADGSGLDLGKFLRPHLPPPALQKDSPNLLRRNLRSAAGFHVGGRLWVSRMRPVPAPGCLTVSARHERLCNA